MPVSYGSVNNKNNRAFSKAKCSNMEILPHPKPITQVIPSGRQPVELSTTHLPVICQLSFSRAESGQIQGRSIFFQTKTPYSPTYGTNMHNLMRISSKTHNPRRGQNPGTNMEILRSKDAITKTCLLALFQKPILRASSFPHRPPIKIWPSPPDFFATLYSLSSPGPAHGPCGHLYRLPSLCAMVGYA